MVCIYTILKSRSLFTMKQAKIQGDVRTMLR